MAEKESGEIKLIVVHIGSQMFGIDMMAVREIRAWSEPTPLPQAPHFVRGMIQLRGTVIPVIDLRDRLGLGETVATTTSVLVIAEIGLRLVSLLVDGVCDLVALSRASLQAAPHIQDDASRLFVTATATLNEQILSLISLDSVVPKCLSEAA
ncbi:MAG: chemotaxis protein CheW [Rhizomicrobium sp.]|jgi:purine-binding chemotaxis protein CheW